MNQGVRTVIYSVKDIAQAKTLYSKLLVVEPYMDQAYYVGFRVGDQEIGLDPHVHSSRMTGPVGYFHVSDIQQIWVKVRHTSRPRSLLSEPSAYLPLMLLTNGE